LLREAADVARFAQRIGAQGGLELRHCGLGRRKYLRALRRAQARRRDNGDAVDEARRGLGGARGHIAELRSALVHVDNLKRRKSATGACARLGGLERHQSVGRDGLHCRRDRVTQRVVRDARVGGDGRRKHRERNPGCEVRLGRRRRRRPRHEQAHVLAARPRQQVVVVAREVVVREEAVLGHHAVAVAEGISQPSARGHLVAGELSAFSLRRRLLGEPAAHHDHANV